MVLLDVLKELRDKQNALDIVTEAMKKSIPLMPKDYEVNSLGGKDGYCASCGEYVSQNTEEWDDYCPHCGQKLLWEE